jgi:hypothetical protein
MRLALLALTLLVPLDAVAGPCVSHEATSVTLSPRDVKLPADGGIIVASSTIGLGGEGGSADAMNPSWRFRGANDTEYKPQLVRLAPGLVSYRPPADAVGPLALAAGNISLRTLERSTAEEATLKPPIVVRVRAKTTASKPSSPGTTMVYVDLKAKPSKDAFALVLFAVAKDGTLTPRSWGLVSDDAKSFNVYQSPGRCEPRIPGVEATGSGEKVQIAWVDAKGRLSPPSKTITVQRGR